MTRSEETKRRGKGRRSQNQKKNSGNIKENVEVTTKEHIIVLISIKNLCQVITILKTEQRKEQ